MSKFKLAGKKKKAGRSGAAAVPCVIIVIGIFVAIMLLFYFALKG